MIFELIIVSLSYKICPAAKSCHDIQKRTPRQWNASNSVDPVSARRSLDN